MTQELEIHGHPAGQQDIEQLVAALGAHATKLAADVPGDLRRVSLRAGDAMVEVEWAEAAAGIGRPAAPTAAEAVDELAVGETIDSPMVGTFYHAPEPGSPPFVTVGDSVEADTVIGIVEAMKLMNRITAQRCGVVAAVLVADGQAVEYGQPLIELAPATTTGDR